MLYQTNELTEQALLPFLPLPASDLPMSYKISQALQEVLEKQDCYPGEEVFIPSLMVLGRIFETSHLDVHDALQHLRRLGYDYELDGMDDAIRLWVKNA